MVLDRTASPVSRVALGTAQFGMRYGIANRSGQVSLQEVEAILERAQSAGVQVLDSAAAYGDCEKRLGEIGIGGWRVVSKLPRVPQQESDLEGWALHVVTESLRLLKISRL
jgi:aryl-alcohol dehydrogenase-like predicted oxidoreductase